MVSIQIFIIIICDSLDQSALNSSGQIMPYMYMYISQLLARQGYRPYSTDVTHYVISLFSGYYLIIFRYMSGKRVVGSTAILEIRAAWNLPF